MSALQHSPPSLASRERGKVVIREPELTPDQCAGLVPCCRRKAGGQRSAAQGPGAKALVDHQAGLLVSLPRREGVKVTKGVKPHWEVLKQNLLSPIKRPKRTNATYANKMQSRQRRLRTHLYTGGKEPPGTFISSLREPAGKVNCHRPVVKISPTLLQEFHLLLLSTPVMKMSPMFLPHFSAPCHPRGTLIVSDLCSLTSTCHHEGGDRE